MVWWLSEGGRVDDFSIGVVYLAAHGLLKRLRLLDRYMFDVATIRSPGIS